MSYSVDPELRADCTRCAGLCCVAPGFVTSADFAIDKPPGTPCPNLSPDFRCGIHRDLRDRGFPGCTVFDCFGAGQHLTQVTFVGRNWRDDLSTASAMFAAFPVMRQLHEMLWYLAEARDLVPAGPLRDDIDAARASTQRHSDATADQPSTFDTAAYRQELGQLLGRVSEAVRPLPGPDCRGADLVGVDLAGRDLRAASLRGAYLIGADLARADLRRADLLGADMRAADLRGAFLDTAIFLTQPQLDAAHGDSATTIPARLNRPSHW